MHEICNSNTFTKRGVMAMTEWLSSDGKLITTMSKLGQIIMLSVVGLLCCIPIITIGSSITSFYYAMVKSVRRERSYPVKEFFCSFKRTLGSGCFFTVLLGITGYLLYRNREYVAQAGNRNTLMMVIIYDALVFVFIGFMAYIFPALSRFQMKWSNLLKMALLMEFRHLPYTIGFLVGTIVCGYLLWVLPLPFWLILPGGWCYVSSIFMERILKIYTPQPQEGEDAWYYDEK